MEETEVWIDFQWEVLLNRELKTRILELGADAEVLAPKVLREEIGGILKTAAVRYE